MELSIKEKESLRTKYGDWAIITGASSGIGFELSKQLAQAGLNLIINGRNEERLKTAQRRLEETNIVQIKPVVADLSESAGITELIEAAEALKVGLLINNAGFGTSGLFSNSMLDEEINMLRVNCEAVLSLTHHFSKKFKLQRKGGIIFLSSLVAFQGVAYAANYAATKAYIQSFSEALSVELRPFNVHVLAAAPGPVSSGFKLRSNMKMVHSLQPPDIAAPILKALGKKSTVVPGNLSKILVYSLRSVPRWAKIRIMKNVMMNMTKHQRMNEWGK